MADTLKRSLDPGLGFTSGAKSWKGLFPRKSEPASLPQGTRVYAVGDIHGRLDLLDELLTQIRRDAQGGPSRQVLIFVGDYVDRGPDSNGVITRLLSLQSEFEALFLRGNHDQALLDFLADPEFYRVWKGYGAPETLVSYGVRPPLFEQRKFLFDARNQLLTAMPPSHVEFLNSLKPFTDMGGYYFTHAGVRPGVSLSSQRNEDLMWIREDFLSSTADFGKVIVHGHSVSTLPVSRSNRIGIDTGAFATGRLTALVLEGTGRRLLQT